MNTVTSLENADFFTTEALPPDLKQQFLDKLWPRTTSPVADQVVEFDAYFNYILEECNPAVSKDHAIRTYDDILFIVETLRRHPALNFAETVLLIEQLRPALSANRRKLSISIELAVRVWLMCNIRNVMPLDRKQLQTSIPWPDESSLKSVFHQHMSQHQYDPTVNFPAYINLYEMHRIGGIRVDWTNNLTSHLTMKDSVILVFHNVSVLKRMRESSSSIPFLPLEFIDETLATIDLLIPLTKPGCNGWLVGELERAGLDGNLMYRDAPNQSKAAYRYWQERLLIIEETFGKTKPRSFFQAWYDTRDMQQWWGFWLVVSGLVLTVLFGLIQSITGIIQVTGSK